MIKEPVEEKKEEEKIIEKRPSVENKKSGIIKVV